MKQLRVVFQGDAETAASFVRELERSLSEMGIPTHAPTVSEKSGTRGDIAGASELLIIIAEHTTALVVAECLKSFLMRTSKLRILLGRSGEEVRLKNNNPSDASGLSDAIAKNLEEENRR